MKKQKCLKLGPKMTYFGIFDQKSIIWVFLRKNFKNAIVIFEISTPKFASFRNFKNKQKCLNFAPKMPYWVFLTKNTVFRYLWIRIKKKLLSYLKSAPSNLSTSKFSRKKQKYLTLRSKMPDLYIFGLEFEHNIVIFEINTLDFA